MRVEARNETRGQGDGATRRHADAATQRQDGCRLSKPVRVRRTLWRLSQGAFLILAIVCLSSSLDAQTKKRTSSKSQTKSQTTLDTQIAKAKADLVKAASDYKDSLQKLLAFEEDDVKLATATLEKRKALLSQNIISKKEVEDSERALATAQSKVDDTKKQIGESDNLIAEATGEQQLEKLGKSRVGAYQVTAALIRYNGPAHWMLSDASKVEGFFASRFKHALPISAFGQTAVHDHLGFDHHNAMDVALSPDSTEGKALMDYLRGQGIPFIAFHYAVRGSATGAHIHVGSPSHRLAK